MAGNTGMAIWNCNPANSANSYTYADCYTPNRTTNSDGNGNTYRYPGASTSRAGSGSTMRFKL